MPVFVCTETPRAQGRTSRSRLVVFTPEGRRAVAPDFFASADAAVSFDGTRLLFSGRRTANDRWQIWEVAVSGGAPRRVTAFSEDAVRPAYLPDNRFAYARRTPGGYQIESAPLSGGAPLRLTYAPGDHLPCDVLHDGRILFEAPEPRGADLYTVYTDGSGVETYRCDHGHQRRAGRQLASGDLVFQDGTRLARFTSAVARQVEISLPAGQFTGPVAEIGPGDWLVSWRPNARMPFALYRWPTGGPRLEKIAAIPQANLLQPVLVRPRAVPLRHPSALGKREGGNVLCLNVYTARAPIAPGTVAAVRVYTQEECGTPRLLGRTAVERDGSFFVQVPSEKPLRFELLDGAGRVIRAEQGWFWMRRGEQRVCVGCHAGPERAPENAVPQILLRPNVPVRMMP